MNYMLRSWANFVFAHAILIAVFAVLLPAFALYSIVFSIVMSAIAAICYTVAYFKQKHSEWYAKRPIHDESCACRGHGILTYWGTDYEYCPFDRLGNPK